MGFGSFIKKAVKRTINPSRLAEDTGKFWGSAVGKVTGSFMEGMSGGPEADTSAQEAAEALLAETEAEKKRKQQAAEELNPTGALGAGAPIVSRKNILGVS